MEEYGDKTTLEDRFYKVGRSIYLNARQRKMMDAMEREGRRQRHAAAATKAAANSSDMG